MMYIHGNNETDKTINDNDSLFWLSNVIVPFIVNRTVKTH